MGHFNGRLKNAIDDAVERVKNKSFYACLASHGFYDIADQDNGLTDFQRAAVPEYNQHRMSQLADAIADMFADILGNDEYGILSVAMEEIVNRLDERASMTAGEMDTIGGVIGGLTGGASESARQAISSAIAAAMGGNKFHPDVIPPISFGFSGFPIELANCYKPGMLAPDYTFLYDWEARKEPGFYDNGGDLYVGAGIPVSLGGAAKILILKTIFAVPSIDEKMNPRGDMEGGLSVEEFDVIKKYMNNKAYEVINEEDVKNFTITDEQRRASFNRYIHFVLWEAIRNPNNWAYLHWGIITHNSCPSNLRTAICSFLRTNGLALDPAINPEAAMISYCLNAGMAYYIGRNTPITLVGNAHNKITALDADKKTVVEVAPNTAAQYAGVKKDRKLAMLHFTWIADILAHMTNGTSENDVHMRKRRVAEANLIYSMVGLPTIEYGSSVGGYHREHTGAALQQRGFIDLMASTVYVFDNKPANLMASGDVKIVFQNSNIDPNGTILQTRSKQVIKYAASLAGIKTVAISSLYRDPAKQGASMADNMHAGNIIKYAAPGTAVNNIYVNDSRKHPGDKSGKVEENYFRTVTKPAMVKKCKELCANGEVVSRHCWDYEKVQAIDMSHKQMMKQFRVSEDQIARFCNVLNDLKKKGVLKQFIAPDGMGSPAARTGEPAIHIEVWTSGSGSQIPVPTAESDPTALSPSEKDQTVIIRNPNLKSAKSLDAVFVKDEVDNKNKG